MATQIPPWLNIDPIAPARIQLAANQRRATSAAAARRAALEEQRLMAQQEMMYARIAAQERSDARKQEVFRQTRDAQLAQQAAAMEFRRSIAQQQNQRQMRQLRLREQQVEQQASSASRKLLGMRNFQNDVKTMGPEQALVKNAADLFSDRPERLAAALKATRMGQPPQEFTTAGGVTGVYNPANGAFRFPPQGAAALGPDAFTARQITDESGNPIPGMRAIPGQRSARILPGARTGLSPEGEVRRITALLALEMKTAMGGRTKAERDAATLKVNDYKSQLENFGKAAPTERLPGKEDEREMAPGEEEDFILPPTGGEEEDMSVGDGGEEEAMLEEEPDEEELALDEEF